MKTYGITDTGQLVFEDDVPAGIPVVVWQPFAGKHHRVFLPSYPLLTDEFMQAKGIDERTEIFMQVGRGDCQFYRMPLKVFDAATRIVRTIGEIGPMQRWHFDERQEGA